MARDMQQQKEEGRKTEKKSVGESSASRSVVPLLISVSRDRKFKDAKRMREDAERNATATGEERERRGEEARLRLRVCISAGGGNSGGEGQGRRKPRRERRTQAARETGCTPVETAA